MAATIIITITPAIIVIKFASDIFPSVFTVSFIIAPALCSENIIKQKKQVIK
jgi:hypothetical protein